MRRRTCCAADSPSIPATPALHDNLGNVLKDAGELDEAIDCFRRALELDPAQSGDAQQSCLRAQLSIAGAANPFSRNAARWSARFAAPLARRATGPCARSLAGPPAQDRLRLARTFATTARALFTLPLLVAPRPAAFEIFCYSSVERPDDVHAAHRELTPTCGARCARWMTRRSADVIRDDGIDILVDLTMHMANGRPLVFARKPAPVQIAWLAYPGTTGMDAIDYRLSDPRLDPRGLRRSLHASARCACPIRSGATTR